MEFWHSKWACQRKLALDRASRDALAELCRTRWPSGTAKLAAREWDLTVDEARGVVAGRCSFTTYDKIIKRPGGFLVGLRVLEIVTGQNVAQFFHQQVQQAAKAAEHAQEHERLAQAAYRRLESPSADHSEDRREGRSFGAMGAETARRVAERS